MAHLLEEYKGRGQQLENRPCEIQYLLWDCPHKEKVMKVKQVSLQCGIGMCPAVFEVVSECALGACPTVFEAGPSGMKQNDQQPEAGAVGFHQEPQQMVMGTASFNNAEGDLIIVGYVLTPEELRAVAHKISKDAETAVRVPKSLIASLKF